jgi:hypothetical protein
MVDPTLAQLMEDLTRYRPMLEQMYKRWLEEQSGEQEIDINPDNPVSPAIQITVTQTGDKR